MTLHNEIMNLQIDGPSNDSYKLGHRDARHAAAELALAAEAEIKRLQDLNAELVGALRDLVQNEGLDAFVHLDRGIGTATASGQRWLRARTLSKQ